MTFPKLFRATLICLIVLTVQQFYAIQNVSAWGHRFRNMGGISAETCLDAEKCLDAEPGVELFFSNGCELFKVGPTINLFNGKDLTGWTNAEGKGVNKNWVVSEGTIFRAANGGDLYTADSYDNFILEFEFKVAKGCNSGLKYRSWTTHGWGMGYEFQAFDGDLKKTLPYHRTGALYEMFEPMTPPELFKKEQFNKGKIVVMGNYIEHWLNGQLAVCCEIGSCDWLFRQAQSKFAEVKEFGTTEKGRILLQDHNDSVWFKNLKITKLERVSCCF